MATNLTAKKREDLVSFLAMGANIDDNVGRLDQFLAESGLQENTIVVFLTDNGSTMGKDYFNAGMRGQKTQLWEGGHRVPCFIRWPGGDIGTPREIDELCQVQDLLPTLADLSGVAASRQRNWMDRVWHHSCEATWKRWMIACWSSTTVACQVFKSSTRKETQQSRTVTGRVCCGRNGDYWKTASCTTSKTTRTRIMMWLRSTPRSSRKMRTHLEQLVE